MQKKKKRLNTIWCMTRVNKFAKKAFLFFFAFSKLQKLYLSCIVYKYLAVVQLNLTYVGIF